MSLWLHVSVSDQVMSVYDDKRIVASYPICTAKKGVGEQMGSEMTPRGWHYIRAKIGDGQPVNSVLVGRRPTGEIYDDALHDDHPERDWILTRIMWLCGLEPGKNRGGNVDTMRRYIYIHGTPPRRFAKRPSSHGCIGMQNEDLLALFEQAPLFTKLLIEA